MSPRQYFLRKPSKPVFVAMATTRTTERTWPELLGSNNWKGLLEPLDLDLRRLILRSGDFCQATYDAFNNDQNSKYCGSSRYGKQSFFQKVMLDSASDYQVSSSLYATAQVTVHEAFLLHALSREAWDRESNWIGYIAVTTDEASKSLGRREIYVAWRGTTRNYEWVDVLSAKLESAKPLLQSKVFKTRPDEGNDSSTDSGEDDESVPKVMLGWLTVYTSSDPKSSFTKQSARAQLLTQIKKLVNQYKDEKLSITFTGHSPGASLSILSAFDIVENEISDIPVTAFVFGCPRVGQLLGYVSSGTELVIDTRMSASLKDSTNPSDWHNLQGMLHIVAGWNGADGEFKLEVERSPALVNKSSEFLKDEYLIPGSWWVEKNKGLVRDEKGEWVLDHNLNMLVVTHQSFRGVSQHAQALV
ncbi:hypothetical protein F0562_008516 [Nyssa sinensis]|uniref:Phospholipase A1 n=1 Tax=Nyssa sinensis TaxID=561372 RepID=A0A5J5AAE6_9ASTE|nr:hypothetical protein F0562_008516 [Nyssa sinensis]